jgi:hypothetical protein
MWAMAGVNPFYSYGVCFGDKHLGSLHDDKAGVPHVGGGASGGADAERHKGLAAQLFANRIDDHADNSVGFPST